LKKIFLLILALLFLFPTINLYSQYTEWENISNRIPGDSLNNLSDAYLIRRWVGWISSSSNPEIYRTTDSGQTWEVQNTQSPITTINFYYYTIGYAGGIDGIVFKTTDIFDNWINIGSIGKPINDISFIIDFNFNPIGYICGDDGALWAINDTILMDLSSGLSVNFSAISSPQINNVWFCGDSSIYFYDGNIITKQFTTSVPLNSIHIDFQFYGWVVGDSGYIALTSDGGKNWIQKQNPDTLKRNLNDINLVGRYGWVVGDDGLILRTIDAGETWVIDNDWLTPNKLISVQGVGFGPALAVGGNKTALINPTVVSVDDEPTITDDFELFQNYPNPFNPTTMIKYEIPELSFVMLRVYDVLGNEISTIVSEEKPAGEYEVDFDGSGLTSGIYFYQLSAEDYTETRKMILLR